ncbi:MAG: DinB family protein [Nitrospinaceae bacterium]|jgi:hypothetical protein|nr:DinB family protein [Nitrospinaceae bacterium]MBT3434942.1 DinB family protein [Nitrospinaceae bacterium]MBT5369663.1 DinB family protein [Nitrospinaceae bacterium]MBT5946137.1 DinB family protein [Nitrospinaceae bacterium]MBT6394193.1 DinB family protein [Nitrospinaceae bacterium]
MESPVFFMNVLARNALQVQKALVGMTEEDLRMTPNQENVNPAGWLVWHQTRFVDTVFSHIGGKTQAWVEGNWSEKFPGTPPEPEKTGRLDTMAQVMGMTFTSEALTAYLDAALERAKDVASGLTSADFDREIENPVRDGKIKLGDMLAIVTTDFLHHSGQVCLLRGYITGPGWW